MHLVVPSQILIIGLSCEFQHKTPSLTTQNPILNSPFQLLYIPQFQLPELGLHQLRPCACSLEMSFKGPSNILAHSKYNWLKCAR